jgi:NAD(P)H-flavin reductase
MSTATPESTPVAGDALVPRVARVSRRRRETPGTWTLDLAADGSAVAFAPGQFHMLTAFGVGEVAVSLSGDPADRSRFVHTIRAVGPVSRAIAALRAGDLLGVRGPFGVSWPLEQARGGDVVVVAGGLGLAPLRPALYRLMSDRAHYRDVRLLYGARMPAEILYAREFARWRRRGIDVRVTVDRAAADWSGQVGVVTRLLAGAVRDAAATAAFVCGPEIMMRFAIAELRNASVAETSIHLSLERNMKCAVAWCGRCQIGGMLVCRDGPIFRYDRVARELAIRER